MAAKIVPPQKSATLKNELNNFLLYHPNIVQTLRIISNDENCSFGLVIMEMCSGLNLEHLTQDESFVLDDKSITRFCFSIKSFPFHNVIIIIIIIFSFLPYSYMTDISRALGHCHSQKVLHLDVKPKNILVNLTTNVCKLCDFGSSCLFMGVDNAGADYKALVKSSSIIIINVFLQP